MNLRPLIAAAALALAPVVTSAATIVAGGGATINGTENISVGDVWTVDIDANAEGAGSFFLGATATEALLTIETNTINPSSSFVNARAEWNTADDGTGTTLASISLPLINNASNEMLLRFDTGDTAYLLIAWDSVSADSSDFDIRIAATQIPVPAGILLMGTALAGFGVMRRRKKAA